MLNQPPIFLINLDKSKDRLDAALQRLEPFELDITRVSAVVGKDITTDELAKFYSEEKNRSEYHRKLGPGEIGCYMSHLQIMKHIVDEEIPYAFILEDDFKVIGDLSAAVDAIAAIEFNWDMVKLAEYGERVRPTAHEFYLNDNFNLKIQKKLSAGTCAQAVSLTGAQKILKTCVPFGRPIDTDYQYWWEKELEIFTLSPTPLQQDLEFESTISKMASGMSFKKAFLKRKLQQCKKAILNRKYTNNLVNKYKR